jgi:hypothetical protein
MALASACQVEANDEMLRLNLVTRQRSPRKLKPAAICCKSSDLSEADAGAMLNDNRRHLQVA